MSNPPQSARRISVTATQGGELEEFSPLRSAVGEIGDRNSPRLSRQRSHAPTATDFTSERLLRPRSEVPRSGLRWLIYRVTGGRINLGPSQTELAERDMVARAKARVVGCRRIAVMSRKGGVGKTTTTLQLGHTFASHRGDRVIALDGNPDAGSLAYRVRRETTATITDLLRDRDSIARYADIRAYTSQAVTRLEVVAADDDPSITEGLREQDFYSVVDLLEHHYNLVLMDTGTGVLESASKGIVELADQLVVVAGPSLDTARTAMSTLDWLGKHGHADLVANAVAVINRASWTSTASRSCSPSGSPQSCASRGTRSSRPERRPRSRSSRRRRARPISNSPPQSRTASTSTYRSRGAGRVARSRSKAHGRTDEEAAAAP
jgi:MinD-like ATPase involved in chromosome partitioning or flagellar assembly